MMRESAAVLSSHPVNEHAIFHGSCSFWTKSVSRRRLEVGDFRESALVDGLLHPVEELVPLAETQVDFGNPDVVPGRAAGRRSGGQRFG
jgi:hypothetical protein